MTRFLASVTGPDEAETAIGGGADIIDLKEPANGALGAVPPDVIRATVARVAGRRDTSAVAGDLPMQPETVRAVAATIAATGVDYVKLGMFAGGDAAATVRALADVANTTKLVAVLFADAAPDMTLLPLLATAGFAGAMLDTQGKSAGRLLDHMDPLALRGFVEQCHAVRMLAGLAGSLETPDVPRLLVLAPDLLGFRGALCGPGGRASAIDAGRVMEVRALIPAHGEAAKANVVDYRLLAARGYAPAPTSEEGATDLVFVHDLVLPVYIGAYARERDAPQRVRFDVEVAVARGGRAVEDMRDVFSYDIITDAIRMLVGSGHVPLVETLAERIAVTVLAEPRVMRVSVRVQKLETGSGAVGVLIERTRALSRQGGGEIVPLSGPSAS